MNVLSRTFYQMQIHSLLIIIWLALFTGFLALTLAYLAVQMQFSESQLIALSHLPLSSKLSALTTQHKS